MDYFQEAQAVANVFGVPVGIYPTGCDHHAYRHWDWMAPDAAGRLPPGYVDIIYPAKIAAVDYAVAVGG